MGALAEILVIGVGLYLVWRLIVGVLIVVLGSIAGLTVGIVWLSYLLVKCGCKLIKFLLIL